MSSSSLASSSSSFPVPSFNDSSADMGVFGDFSTAELMELIYIALSLSLLSAISSIFIIVTFWKFPRLHTFAYKIIMMLAVANLCLDSAYLVGNVGHDNWKCTAQGFARVYFALVEFALVTAITLTCYVMIVKHEFRIQERFRTAMAYCWLIPFVMACLPFTTNNYGDAGSWCSITAKDLKSLEWGTFWRFAIIYVPLWTCVLVNGYMCVKVYRAMRGLEVAMEAYYDDPSAEGSGDGEEEGEDEVVETRAEAGAGVRAGSVRGGGVLREGRLGPDGVEISTSMPIINRLRLYPIALVVCWGWATVNRVKEAVEPYSDTVFWLYILQYSFQAVHGVLNLIIFLRTPAVMEEWRDALAKWKASRRGVRSVDRSSLLSSRVSDQK